MNLQENISEEVMKPKFKPFRLPFRDCSNDLQVTEKHCPLYDVDNINTFVLPKPPAHHQVSLVMF